MSRLIAILPCNDLDASLRFYERLGFRCVSDYGNYKLLADGQGAELHLNQVAEGWVIPGRSPFGLYLYADNVDELAAQMGEWVLHRAENKAWGMYEFAMSDPDEHLVRVGRLIRP